MSFSPIFTSIRFFKFHSKCMKNYYQILGISRNATQAEVKNAYYRLSMANHPDHNQGSREAGKVFQEINAAYEVLGHVHRRRLYDKELFRDKNIQQPYHATHQAAYARQSPSSTGRNYDFDEWARAQYQESFARRNNAKQRYKVEFEAQSCKRDKSIIFLRLAVLFIIMVVFALNSDLDKLRTGKSGSLSEEPKEKK